MVHLAHGLLSNHRTAACWVTVDLHKIVYINIFWKGGFAPPEPPATIDTIGYVPGIGNGSRAPINTIQVIFATRVIMLKRFLWDSSSSARRS
jgi:hypothetical protein